MDIIIKITGVVFTGIAIVLLLKPGFMKQLMEFFKKGIRIYIAGLVRLALAVVFFSSYRECDKQWIIFAFGILLLISAVLIFMLGPARIKPIIDWYQKQSSLLLRMAALILLAAGTVIIYAA